MGRFKEIWSEAEAGEVLQGLRAQEILTELMNLKANVDHDLLRAQFYNEAPTMETLQEISDALREIKNKYS